MSLRARLTLTAALAVALAVAFASGVVYLAVRAELMAQIDRTLEERADVIGQRLEGPAGAVAVPGPEAFTVPLGAAALGRDAVYVQIVPATGAAVDPAGEPARVPISPEDRDVAVTGGEPRLDTRVTAGTRVRVLTTSVGPGLAVQLARPLDEVDRVLRRLAWTLGLITLAGAAVAAVLGRGVAQAALAPVRRLTAAAEHVTSTRDLSRRIDASGRDELGRLATSFNAMLTALDGALRSQRQLVADASHELRTPLTSMRTNVEVFRRADELPPAERERLVEDVVAQLEELSALVTDLVDLARDEVDEGALAPVRLDRLTAGALDRARRHAPTLRFEASLDPVTVTAVASRLDRAVANLLDNAAKWSQADGLVEVTLRSENGHARLTVRDHGPGIGEADLPRVFDRFYRGAEARALPGSGLGLAIVRQVAEAHGGSVRADNAPDGGAILELAVPRVGASGVAPSGETTDPGPLAGEETR
jgi:two-component system sensor histidine kinase MprB